MENSLLSEKAKESEIWNSYQYLQRDTSFDRNSSFTRTDVMVQKVHFADDMAIYPPVNQTVPTPQAIGYPTSEKGQEMQRLNLDETEIRELLIDHIGHRCCWGSRPARTWKILAVEDCDVYVGTLDTFIEEREASTRTVPFAGGDYNKKKHGYEPELWQLDMTSQFPSLFVSYKETKVPVPNSESVHKCTGCIGRGVAICPTCNGDKEMMICFVCFGRCFITHEDGSNTICGYCTGKGKLSCVNCQSRGFIKCQTCKGTGSLMTSKIAVVRWKTVTKQKVSATRGSGSIPENVFHRAEGVQLCNTQAYKCTPAYFADSHFLNNFSSEVILLRADIPPTANVVCERHTISIVPVTRVTMEDRGQAFSFYIIGFGKEIHMKDYYPARFCWGFCPCLEWLKI